MVFGGSRTRLLHARVAVTGRSGAICQCGPYKTGCTSIPLNRASSTFSVFPYVAKLPRQRGFAFQQHRSYSNKGSGATDPPSEELEERPEEPVKRGDITIFHRVSDIRQHRASLRLERISVGLVPTMGALHGGHLQLIRQAARENDQIFVSIFVNPTQFGVNEDLNAYPRTFESDLKQLQELNKELEAEKMQGRITTVFAPSVKTMYPIMPPTSEIDGHGSFVIITPIGSILEGAARPVFFRGVATVCMKLFNIMDPDHVYFGQKDVQQSIIIKRLVTDFHLSIKVRIVPTEREADGLAMSSRNVYLGSRRRRFALMLYTALKIAELQYMEQKITQRDDILGPALSFLDQELQDQLEMSEETRVLFEVDYISLADPDTMEEVDEIDEEKGAVLSGAVKMLPVENVEDGEDKGEAGGVYRPVRLIDNIILQPGRKS